MQANNSPFTNSCMHTTVRSILYATRTSVDFKHRRGMQAVNQRRDEILVAQQNRPSLAPTYTADPLSELRAHILQTVSDQTMLLATFKRFSLQTGTGNSVISLKNFKRGLKACGVTLPESAALSLFNRLDQDGSGHIDLTEFANGIFSKQHTSLKSTKDHYVAVRYVHAMVHAMVVYVYLVTHATVLCAWGCAKFDRWLPDLTMDNFLALDTPQMFT